MKKKVSLPVEKMPFGAINERGEWLRQFETEQVAKKWCEKYEATFVDRRHDKTSRKWAD